MYLFSYTLRISEVYLFLVSDSPMTRGGSYYQDFQRYGGRGQYNYGRYFSSYRESDEERAARKARERRDAEERRDRRDRDEHRDSPQRGDDSHKRKSHDDRGKGHVVEDSSKRARYGERHASTTPDKPTAPAPLDISSDSPALGKEDIQTIISRPKFQVGPGPATLQSRFPQWCLKGVRFDLDLVPIDKPAMLRNLDAVKLDIERMSNWQKLVDELQRVNRANLEAMLTMENDKAEWQKVLEQHDTEMRNITSYNEELEAKVEKLKDELAASSTSYSQKEEVLLKQVRDAHASQRDAEDRLEVQKRISEGYISDIAELHKKNNSQEAEIQMLKLQLSRTERERDEAVAGRIAAEESHEETKNSFGSTLFDFYLHSVLGRGSLAFLGPKYEMTLAEVWEAALDMLGAEGAGYDESALERHYFDEDARAALAKGKEQLAKLRTEVAEGGQIGGTTSTTPVQPPSSSEVNITGSSSHLASPTKVTTKITSVHGGDEGDESAGTQAYEVEIRKSASPGNSHVNPATVNPVQAGYTFVSYEFHELLGYLLNLDEPSSPLSTNFIGEPSSPLFY
jgi:hypothetical protein